MSQEHTLRAMALNYGDGPHTWDHLDKDVCAKAADEIKRLRKALTLCIENIDGIANGTDTPSTAIRAYASAALKSEGHVSENSHEQA